MKEMVGNKFVISDHVSLKEATRSNTAERLGINNFPDSDTLLTMKITAENIFEPLRKKIGEPIYITSFYRSPELNKTIGGSSKSQHCLGEAIDIDDVYSNASNADFFNYIKDYLEFDQLIWEFGDDYNPAWVHVSYSLGENRMRILRAIKENNKTKYILWNQ
jgi:zinc D-Ala-D-Ala carboxypeptidase